MTDALFYKNVMPLNKDRHGDWYVEPLTGYEFARDTNSVFLMTVEFSKAAKEYPIVFIGQDDSIFPVAILGYKENENLFITDDGSWDARYIPAYVRRYPFIPATGQGRDDLTVCIDEDFSGFNQKKKGEPLFEKNGELSPVLEKSVAFLQEYQGQYQVTANFCDEIKKLDILEPMSAKIDLKSGDSYTLGSFLAVNRERFTSLGTNKIKELFKTGAMEVIYTHLFSLTNFETLMGKMKVDK